MSDNASIAGADSDIAGVVETSSGRGLKCRYCANWSASKCPWSLFGTPLAMWGEKLPWARGKPAKPVGSLCKPCAVVSELNQYRILISDF